MYEKRNGKYKPIKYSCCGSAKESIGNDISEDCRNEDEEAPA